MLLNNINELKRSSEQAVIINVNTKLVTTLALLSALKYADMPILLIDCESTDGSLEHFTELMEKHDFDLLSAPLKKHGHTLDWFFENVSSEKVLLIDSDLEILNSDILNMMRNFIDNETVFGCGFTHGPDLVKDNIGSWKYIERMWIPITMLKVSHIKDAVIGGYSFLDKMHYAKLPFSIAKFLALSSEASFLNSWKPWLLKCFMRCFYGAKPYYAYSDTGAEIHQYLKHHRRLFFVGFPAELQHNKYVMHFHGVTRLLLDKTDMHGTQLNDIESQVQERLYSIYGINLT